VRGEVVVDPGEVVRMVRSEVTLKLQVVDKQDSQKAARYRRCYHDCGVCSDLSVATECHTVPCGTTLQLRSAGGFKGRSYQCMASTRRGC
jgi:hypothetical protein